MILKYTTFIFLPTIQNIPDLFNYKIPELFLCFSVFSLMCILFALIYKVLPDTEVEWRAKWVCSLVVGLLFITGKLLINNNSSGFTYGAVGSTVIAQSWAFYSPILLYLGV